MTKSLIDWRKSKSLSQAEAAAKVDVGQPAWAKWEGGKVPPEQCLKVHRLTGIALHDLRPDIYPRPKRKREGAGA
jgi:predicted transcriptional regulator